MWAEAHCGELCCYQESSGNCNVSPSAVIVSLLYLVTPAAAVNAAHHRLHLHVNGFISSTQRSALSLLLPESPNVLFQMRKCSEASLTLSLMNPPLIISCGFKTRICKQSYSWTCRSSRTCPGRLLQSFRLLNFQSVLNVRRVFLHLLSSVRNPHPVVIWLFKMHDNTNGVNIELGRRQNQFTSQSILCGVRLRQNN